MRTTIIAAILSLSAAAAAGAQCPALTGTPAPASQLSYTLKQLDTASAKFQRAMADFRWDYYERVVRDTTTQNGSIYFEHDKKGVNMGAVVLAPKQSGKGKPVYSNILEYQAGTLRIFNPPPGADQLTIVKAGANQAQYEGFLTLGFGGSGTDLAKSWNVTDMGAETIDGTKTEKLDLISKTGDKNFTHVTIWVDLNRGVSLKQIFYTPSKDCRTATYSNVVVNGNVHKDHFQIKTDGNTTVINR